MSLNVTNHFHKIKIIEPDFSKFYNTHYKETDYNKYQDEIREAIRKHLRHLLTKESRGVGVLIDTEKMLYKPLVEKGLEFEDVVYTIRELFSDEVGYLKQLSNSPDSLSLTVKGKNWVTGKEESSQPAIPTKANQESEQVFIAAWFDDKMDENIKAIEDGISEAGFDPMCIRDKHFSERIMDKALGEIRKSRFVVADLTGSRQSVFFEAGFAFGLGIDMIYVYKETNNEEESKLEFYVKHFRCYKYKTAGELKKLIKTAISGRVQNK